MTEFSEEELNIGIDKMMVLGMLSVVKGTDNDLRVSKKFMELLKDNAIMIRGKHHGQDIETILNAVLILTIVQMIGSVKDLEMELFVRIFHSMVEMGRMGL